MYMLAKFHGIKINFADFRIISFNSMVILPIKNIQTRLEKKIIIVKFSSFEMVDF